MNKITNNSITLLVDYRNYFYSSQKHKDASMDLVLLEKSFEDHGYGLTIKRYSDVNFRNECYKGKYVLYQSSEDRDLFYKSYIEDILLGILFQGGILIPDFYKFRAHHNKIFMEILRDISNVEGIKNIQSSYYGCYEEIKDNIQDIVMPVVVKPAEGAVGKGVRLLHNRDELMRYAKRLSRSFSMIDSVKNEIKSLVRGYHVRQSNRRRKFLTQNFVSNLKNDYKIVIYGEKYFVLFRKNRKNDFRASGSGLFEFKEELPSGLLDFAQKVFQGFDCPLMALDVGYNGKEFYLLEYQFVQFGTYTMEKAGFYFTKNNDLWQSVREQSILENELARCVVHYLKQGDFIPHSI